MKDELLGIGSWAAPQKATGKPKTKKGAKSRKTRYFLPHHQPAGVKPPMDPLLRWAQEKDGDPWNAAIIGSK